MSVLMFVCDHQQIGHLGSKGIFAARIDAPKSDGEPGVS